MSHPSSFRVDWENPTLRPSELAVLRLAGSGVTADRDVACRLGLAVDTVTNHWRAILRILDVRCKPGAVAKAWAKGLLTE